MLDIQIGTCNQGDYTTGRNCLFPTILIRGDNITYCMNKKCPSYGEDAKDLYLAAMMQMLAERLSK